MTQLLRYDKNISGMPQVNRRSDKYQKGTEAMLSGVVARSVHERAQLPSITSEESFQRFFYRAMAETRREDLARNYSRLSATERSIFVTALANRGVLDKQKTKPGFRKPRMHVEELKRDRMLSDMTSLLRMKSSAMQAEAATVAPEVYGLAARALLTSQISDKDDKSLSKRDSLYDLKLVNRAFKFLQEANSRANERDLEMYKDSRQTVQAVQDAQAANVQGPQTEQEAKAYQAAQDNMQELEKIQGGYVDEGIVNFHKNATQGEKLRAAAVDSLEGFSEFYRSLRKEGSKNIAAFDAYNETEKKLFVWALSHPSEVVKSVGPLRHNARHDDAKRQQAKQDYAQAGQRTVDASDYRRAALMLLSQEGRYYKAKLSYNQPIVRDAMHFVRAAQMVRVDVLRAKHEAAAKQDKNLSGDARWSGTNAFDVETARLRIDADNVKSMEDFEKFLEKTILMSGEKYHPLLEQFQALDGRSKVLFVQGLSKRSATEGRSDRSRIAPIQAIGNKVNKYGVKDKAARDQMVQAYIEDKRAHEDAEETESFKTEVVASQLDADGKVITPGDAWRAAVNLVSKDTTSLLGGVSEYIDMGMVQRGLNLVRYAEKHLRKYEAEDRVTSATASVANVGGAAANASGANAGGSSNAGSAAGANAAPAPTVEKGYRSQAEELRQRYAEGSAAHKAKIAAHTDKDKYRAVSTASRQNVHDAGGVQDMVSFRAFFAGLMEQDENTTKLAAFDEMTQEEQFLFVRALAHRDVLDRARDDAMLTRYLRLWDLHGYRGREARDEMKKEFADAGLRQGGTVAEPAADEYKAAAYSIISRETRRANWFSKVTHQKAGDDRLLDRALKFISVIREKREKANDEQRNQFMQDQGAEGGQDQLTRRATEEMKLLADNAKDIKSFGQFMAKVADEKRMRKYAALSERDKNLFVLALAKRQSLDQKKKQAEDTGARTRLISHAIAETDQAIAQENDFRLAAYNILGSKGRALGTRRFLWIKSGAANTTLLDEAFRLISETDAKRDEVTKPADRAVIMRQFGVTKLTHQANQTLRKQADEITDMESFEAFFKQEMSEKGKEKFYYTFRVYNDDLKMIFVNAVAKYTKDMTKKPDGEQHIEMKKPVTAETYRAAAYRLLEHVKGNSDALYYAMNMVNAEVQYRFEAQKGASDGHKTMEEFLQKKGWMQGAVIERRTEFDVPLLMRSDAQHTKASWASRKAVETLDAAGRSVSGGRRNMSNSVDTRLESMDHTGVKYGAARFFTRTINPFYQQGPAVDRVAEDEKAKAIENSREGFLKHVLEYAKKESRGSIYNALCAIRGKDFDLLVAALNDRTILDASFETEEETPSSQNEEGRSELLKKYILGTVTLGEDAYRKAAQALNTSRITGKSSVSSELDTHEVRRTVVDWKLLEDALAFVQFIARDEKRMHEQRVRDNRGDASEPEVGGLRKGDGKEGMSLSPVMELFSAGNSARGVYSQSSKIHEGEDMVEDSALQEVRDLVSNTQQVPQVLKNGLDDLDGIDKLKEVIDQIQDSEVVSALTGSVTTIKSLVSNSISLVQNSVDLGMESARMHQLRSQSADYAKQMTLEEKLTIVQESISEAFKMAKELQGKDVAGKVYDILENICALVTTGLSLAGIPKPITKLINSVAGLVIKGARWITDKIIAITNGSRVDKLLDVKNRTHQYNQRVKAFNARPGVPKALKRDLMTEGQMKKQLIRQSGLHSEKGVLDYICRRTSLSLLYAYGDASPRSTNRMAAKQLFVGLKVPFTPGGQPPALGELMAKLKGAH